MKRLILILLEILFFVPALAQYKLEVGCAEYLELNPPAGYVRSATWSCDSEITITEKSEVGAIILVNKWFEGIASVRVTYTYEYLGSYDGYWHASNSSKTYSITCIPGTASISEDNLELKIGQSHTLKYERSDTYGTPVWKSSNEDVATVSQSGRVKAIAPGVATITLDPIIAKPCFCKVHVQNLDATSIKLVPERLTINVGKTATLQPEFAPSGASASVVWRSENESIANVSQSGIVKGISAGKTIILATTENGLSAMANIEVVGEPDAVKLPERLELYVGYNGKLVPVLSPVNSASSYQWQTSDARIVTVDNDGNVCGKNSGVAEITITTQNNKTATCAIEVKTPPNGMDYRNARSRVSALKSFYEDNYR